MNIVLRDLDLNFQEYTFSCYASVINKLRLKRMSTSRFVSTRRTAPVVGLLVFSRRITWQRKIMFEWTEATYTWREDEKKRQIRIANAIIHSNRLTLNPIIRKRTTTFLNNELNSGLERTEGTAKVQVCDDNDYYWSFIGSTWRTAQFSWSRRWQWKYIAKSRNTKKENRAVILRMFQSRDSIDFLEFYFL